MSETSFIVSTCVCVLGCVSVWSDVDGLGCVCWGCVGRVCMVAGHGQRVEYPEWDGSPWSWVVKLMVFIEWFRCVVGVWGVWVLCVSH